MTDSHIPDDDSLVPTKDSLFKQSHGSPSDSSTTTDLSTDDMSVGTSSSTSSTAFDNVGPPPRGSLLDLWDIPFSASTFHPFPELFKEGVVSIDETTFTEDLTDDDSSFSSVGDLELGDKFGPISMMEVN